jgi:hypothetical protein
VPRLPSAVGRVLAWVTTPLEAGLDPAMPGDLAVLWLILGEVLFLLLTMPILGPRQEYDTMSDEMMGSRRRSLRLR